ncbi:hypothetical protein AVEN_78384-1, partial [Araneus ventricosus]
DQKTSSRLFNGWLLGSFTEVANSTACHSQFLPFRFQQQSSSPNALSMRNDRGRSSSVCPQYPLHAKWTGVVRAASAPNTLFMRNGQGSFEQRLPQTPSACEMDLGRSSIVCPTRSFGSSCRLKRVPAA